MRSPADASRPAPQRITEATLRLASIALLGWMLRLELAPEPLRARADVAAQATLGDALARWTRTPALDSLHVTIENVPGAPMRDWLAALRRSGARVTWSASGIPAMALALEPVNEPDGGFRALIAAPPGSVVALRDAAGLIDSVRVPGAGASVPVAALQPPAAAGVGAHAARATPSDSLVPGRLLVLGRAGWETKFVIAALEERGWAVDARIEVAPGLSVEPAAPVVLDTSRYAAVIALDASAAPLAARIARFAREGGGVVLAGDAGRLPALAAVAPAGVGRRVRAAALSFAGGAPRRALSFDALELIRADAVVLDGRDGAVAAAARRVGAGRVVQIGYRESWRWRMTGAGDAPAAHRNWWSAVVGSAAYRAARPVFQRAGGEVDPAPLAALIDVLGEPSARPAAGAAPRAGTGLGGWMFGLLVGLLLLEWASRRARGAP